MNEEAVIADLIFITILFFINIYLAYKAGYKRGKKAKSIGKQAGVKK